MADSHEELLEELDEEDSAEGNGRVDEATVAWCRSFVDQELGAKGIVDPATAWQIIYKAVMWTEEVRESDGVQIPHIIDKDRLLTRDGKPKRGRQKRDADTGRKWYAKAEAVGKRLAQELGLADSDGLAEVLGRVYQQRKRDQNTTSAAFETILGELVNRYLQQASGEKTPYCAKPNWVDLREKLRGYRFSTSKNETPKPDLVIPVNDPMGILSLKWSMRDDHISQMIGEAVKVHSVRPDITIFAVTNEFDLRRLLRVAEDPQIQRVYHVNMALLNEAHRPGQFDTGLIESRKDIDAVRYVLVNHKLRDLSELFEDMLMVLPREQREAWALRQKEARQAEKKAAGRPKGKAKTDRA